MKLKAYVMPESLYAGKYMVVCFDENDKWRLTSHVGSLAEAEAKRDAINSDETHCEECETVIEPNRDKDLCDACWDNFYCECGQRLEDSYGCPGDGFCCKCR